jgi:molybdenum cofactor biosynthesis enzyme MoaA
MRIQTLSLVAGTDKCNASCSYCVSRMTGKEDVTNTGNNQINKRNLHKACTLAKECGTTTVMITGKGEPTLYPDQIVKYLQIIEPYNFPFIELQTNGISLGGDDWSSFLDQTYSLGLNTIAVSLVSQHIEDNKKIFGKKYPDLDKIIWRIHKSGMMVRLTCTMAKGYTDTWEKVLELATFCKEKNVEQLSLAPVRHPYESKDDAAKGWVDNHSITKATISDITHNLYMHGHRLMNLVHGAVVVDLDGVSVCLRDCLTIEPNTSEIRQLIYYPSGRLMYDWQYKGAVLL